MAVRLDASTDSLTRSANLPSELNFSICGWANHQGNGGTNFESLFVLRDSGYAAWAEITLRRSSGNLEISGTTSGAVLMAVPSTGTPFFWAATSAGSGANQLIGYIRTASQNTFTSASAQTSSFVQSTLEIGTGNIGGTTEWWNGRLWNIKCWDRVLSAAELLVESYYRPCMFPSSRNFHWYMDRHDQLFDISGNGRGPTTGGTLTTEDGSFGLWRPRRRIIRPAGVTAYTMAAAQGSYSLSGQTAALRTARRTTAGQGSYSLSGQTSGLKYGHKTGAVQGSYALTGQDAALRAARAAVAARGNYALNGQTVGLNYSGAGPKVMPAAFGLYTLTGQNVTLNYSGGGPAAGGGDDFLVRARRRLRR